MLTPEENALLTQVGPGTPCGDLLRRYCKLDTLAMVLIWEHWRRVA